MAKKKDPTTKKKDGGASNMKVSASEGSSVDDGKKTKSKSKIDMSKGKAKLSSKQYELINKRQVNEKQPW